MDAWLAYAPVKNNPEDAAKVYRKLKHIISTVKLNATNETLERSSNNLDYIKDKLYSPDCSSLFLLENESQECMVTIIDFLKQLQRGWYTYASVSYLSC